MTPPPQQQQQAHQQQKYIPKQQRQTGGQTGGNNQGGAGKMMPNSKMYSKPMQTSGGIPSQQPVQQTINAGGFKTMTINPLPQNQYNLPPPSHYQSQQQQQQQQHQREDRNDGNERNKVNGGESSNSSNSSSSNKSSMQQQQQQQQPQRANNIRIMNPPIPVSFSEPPPPINANMGKPLSMHIPPPHLQSGDAQQAQVQPQAIHVVQQPVTVLPPTAVVVAHPSIHQIHAVPQPQRQPRGGTDGPIMRSRNEEIRQLRQFHNDFQIAPPHQGVIQQMVPQEIVIASGPPSLENSQHINKHQGQPPHVNHHITHHPTPSTPHQDQQKHGSSTTPPQANTPQQQIINNNNVNSSNNSSTVSVNSNSNSTETTASANNNNSNNNGEKAALGTKKFTLNPQAKPFTPRTPSTPTPSR